MEIDMERVILFDYIEYLENFIMQHTNYINYRELFINFILENYEGS